VNVDWDLLADHLGGALDGTPEAARVERLVATDPGWARAANELSAAMDAVAADLRTLPDPALPADIAARLDAALAEAVAPALATAPSGSPPSGSAPAGRSAGEVRRPPSHPGTPRRRRRLTRWSAGLAVAAGVATFAAIGLGSWLGNWEPETAVPGMSEADDAGGDVAAPESRADGQAPQAPDEHYSPQIVASGGDYQEETLADTDPPLDVSLGSQAEPPPATASVPDATQRTVLPELFRLWTDPAARADCLEMITDSLRPPPVTINVVDFEGEPALVIWATTGDGIRWAWVSGPDCGEVAGDPDVQFETQLS
jgi:hypothetical protein